MAEIKLTKVYKTYFVCFDDVDVIDSLGQFKTLEDARESAKHYNNDIEFVKKYGKVHIELQVIEREVIR